MKPKKYKCTGYNWNTMKDRKGKYPADKQGRTSVGGSTTHVNVNIGDKPRMSFDFEYRGSKMRGENPLHVRMRAWSVLVLGAVAAGLFWLQQHVLAAALLVATVATIIVQHEMPRQSRYLYHEASGVLVTRDRLGWKLACGRKVTKVAEALHENEKNLEKVFGSKQGITYRIVISRGVFAKEVRKQKVKWFSAKKAVRKVLAPDKAGYSWFCIAEKRLRTLARAGKDLNDFLDVQATVWQAFTQNYHHFEVVPMGERDLVEASVF